MIKRDLGHGFYAVPRVVVTENGLPSVQLNTQEEPYYGVWCLITLNGYTREYRRQQYEELKKEFGDDD